MLYRVIINDCSPSRRKKLNGKFMVAAPYKKHQNDVNTHRSQIGCKTTQYFWTQSLI
jgi:hypothetical protein